jgi:resuscitation-promoting factor RpfA
MPPSPPVRPDRAQPQTDARRVLLSGGVAAVATATGVAIALTWDPTATTVDALVVQAVQAVGVLACAWYAAAATLSAITLLIEGAGGTWSSGRRLLTRWAPRLVRHVLGAGAVVGVTLVAVVAPSTAVVPENLTVPTAAAAPTAHEVSTPEAERPTSAPAAGRDGADGTSADPTDHVASAAASPEVDQLVPLVVDVAATNGGRTEPEPVAPATPVAAATPVAPGTPVAPAEARPTPPVPVDRAPVDASADTPAGPGAPSHRPLKAAVTVTPTPVTPTPVTPTPVTPTPASALPTPPAAVATHTVRPGDSLWRIAAEHAGSDAAGASWQDWYDANVDVIGDDPDLIRPGAVLTAPSVVLDAPPHPTSPHE